MSEAQLQQLAQRRKVTEAKIAVKEIAHRPVRLIDPYDLSIACRALIRALEKEGY